MHQQPPGITFLTVCHHSPLAHLLDREITIRGHLSILAENSEDALAVATVAVVDVILLDFATFGKDALSVARALLAIRGMAILILISDAGEAQRTGAETTDVSGFLVKPFTSGQFWACVRNSILDYRAKFASLPPIYARCAGSHVPPRSRYSEEECTGNVDRLEG
jgi:DNA-binding response OmpR family regulator